VGSPILKVDGLSCGFHTEQGYLRVVENLSFEVEAGRTVGIVGESGCGKTVSALSIMGLLPKPAGVIESGRILLDGHDLSAAAGPAALRKIRGRRIAMIFQEPMTALNPVHTIGRQVLETVRLHEPALGNAELQGRGIRLLEQVGIPAPLQRLKEYPHQLSGGMRQRVMIAMALSGDPQVLIADEPTTALDVTVQAQILELLRSLQHSRGMAMVFITHDLGVVAELCDEVVVMYAGRVAERGPVRGIFKSARHPYTHGLIASLPGIDTVPKTPLPTIEGVVPAIGSLPKGCRFSNRCRHADALCGSAVPALESCGVGHEVACHHWRRLAT